jgi:nitrile hydratase accessory protein
MIPQLQPEQVGELALPADETIPVFAAPWEASAFAIVLALHRAGRFEWHEWVALLSAEIASAEPDPTGALYYERWTRALEKLVAKIGLLTPDSIEVRSQAWRSAYLATRHGQEVRLTNVGEAPSPLR